MPKFDIQFGSNSNWSIDFEGRLEPQAKTANAIGDDLQAKVWDSLANPLDFPPFEQAIVPGDRIAVLVDPLVPRMAELVAACVRYLVDKGVQIEQLVIVLAGHEPKDAEALHIQLTQVEAAEVPIELHDADDSTKVAYVAANEDSNPIYLNRSVVDADVILPILCGRGRSALDYLGTNSVFPLLSNRATRGEFYSLRKLGEKVEHTKLTAWADQAAWWVGMIFVLEVVPASGHQIAAVISGTPAAVEPEVQKWMDQYWQVEGKSCEAVIAMLEGGPSQQTWENLARALHTARQLARNGGSIILCTELSKTPGEGLQKLRSNSSNDSIARKLATDAADDALAAAVILEATKDCHVYLVSQMPDEIVEGLGMSPVRDAHQLEHLVNQHSTCGLLTSAQHQSFHNAESVTIRS